MTLKPHEALETIPVSPKTNPKESGEYFTIEDGHNHCAYYSVRIGKWYEYELVENETIAGAFPPEEVFPELWYSPISQTIEQIQEEAHKEGWAAKANSHPERTSWSKTWFDSFRKDWLKRNGGE